MTMHRPVSLCVLCRSDKLERVVALKPVPVATPNFKGSSDELCPMNLMLCQACGNLQGSHMLDPEFNYRDYRYTTASSPGLIEHFQDACAQARLRYGLQEHELVVEIGSNDGSYLRCFHNWGHRVAGIDPAKEVGLQAEARGIPTIREFFDDRTARGVGRAYGPAHLILANNVLANLEDLSVITKGVDALLAPDGVFILETQYGMDVIDKMLLDTIYPEHISYFMVKPLSQHFEKHGFQIIAVDRISSKGGSIRVAVQRKDGPRQQRPEVGLMIYEEERRGAFGKEFYAEFAMRVEALRRDLSILLGNGSRLADGYGASVGTSTLMAQLGLKGRVGCLYDDAIDPRDPARVIDGVPVHPGSWLPRPQSDAHCIIFAWRYAERIISKHKDYIARGGKFIVPLPSPRVVG